MVKGRDSRSKDRGFESRHHILDGHFSTYICSKNCNDVCLKKTENKRKRGRGWPIFLKKIMLCPFLSILIGCSKISTNKSAIKLAKHKFTLRFC